MLVLLEFQENSFILNSTMSCVNESGGFHKVLVLDGCPHIMLKLLHYLQSLDPLDMVVNGLCSML